MEGLFIFEGISLIDGKPVIGYYVYSTREKKHLIWKNTEIGAVTYSVDPETVRLIKKTE